MKDNICQEKGTQPSNGDAQITEEENEPPGTCRGIDLAAATLSPETPPISANALLSAEIIKTSIKSRHLTSRPRFTISPRSDAFRKQFFPEATDQDWNDWRWQLKNRIQTREGLSRILKPAPHEWGRPAENHALIPFSITPYYAGLLDPLDSNQPLRRTVVPVEAEQHGTSGEMQDPLGEEHDSPVPGIVHRYPDRVLFLVTGFCSTYCRYCTRSRMVGQAKACRFDTRKLSTAIDYIRETRTVRDVLLSGGDPLTLSNDRLEWLLSQVRAIPHVEVIRIGTKVPAVLPQRITTSLVRMLKRYHPLWMSLHFTHPAELTPESLHACNRLADGGIPLGSQTVLLSGVNDRVEILKELFHGLLKMRVRPYYLYQCDPIPGSSHFRTAVQKGLEILRGLRGHTSGYAIPTYVIDAPSGGGKIPLLPDSVVARNAHALVLRNYEGKLFSYPDSAEEIMPAKGIGS